MYDLDDAQAAEVKRRGFVHIPAFMDGAGLDVLRTGFERIMSAEPKDAYFRLIPGDVCRQFDRRFQPLAATLLRAAGIAVDRVYHGMYFANFAMLPGAGAAPAGLAYPWHQDHESYYTWQDHGDYLNLYLPIEKVDPERSNLTVIPFDRLHERSPALSTRLLRRGATRLVKRRHGWVVADDERGGVLGRVDFDLTEIEETPTLAVGDLLVMRGDVMHRTQDTDTRRVAASFRMMNSRGTVSRRRLARGGPGKAVHLYRSRGVYQAIFRYFDWVGADAVTIDELARYLEFIVELSAMGRTAPLSSGRAAFITRLAWEKCRSVL